MLVVVAGLALGCATPEPAPPPAVPSSPHALLTDMVKAEQTRLPRAYRGVEEAWRGRRVRWTLGYLAALCPTEGPNAPRCHALPFDGAALDAPARHGWLPGLDLTRDQSEGLAAACPDDPCVVTVDGTLAELTFRPDHFPQVGLADVEIVAVRAPREGERWGARFPTPAPVARQ